MNDTPSVDHEPHELYEYYSLDGWAEPDDTARLTAADKIAIVAIAGMAIGLLLAWAYDRVSGGPGIGVMFH